MQNKKVTNNSSDTLKLIQIELDGEKIAKLVIEYLRNLTSDDIRPAT